MLVFCLFSCVLCVYFPNPSPQKNIIFQRGQALYLVRLSGAWDGGCHTVNGQLMFTD